MAGYRATQIRKPASDVEFESNCAVLFSQLLNDPNVHRLGTSGQSQDGVDIIGNRNQDPNHLVGIQCKLKSGSRKLSAREASKEVKLALGYKPPLSEYFIVTTSSDDTKLTQLAEQLMQEQATAGRSIQIIVWGWNTLQEKIDQYELAKQAFDPGFSPAIASQNRKLDVIAALQERAATKEQVAELANALVNEERRASTKLPPRYADQEVDTRLARTLRRRGFARTDVPGELAALAQEVLEGELSLAANRSRAEVCYRAARSNVSPTTLVLSKGLRDKTIQLEPDRDLTVVDALVVEAEGDGERALRMLRDRLDGESRGVLFILLMRQRGDAEALRWVRDQCLAPSDLSAGGVLNIVVKTVEHEGFDAALAFLDRTPETHFDRCPALRLAHAQANLAAVLPPDQKDAVAQGLPLNPKILQFAAGQSGQRGFKAAQHDIAMLLSVVDELGLGNLKPFLLEFELWLRLEIESTRDQAVEQLATEIADPTTTLRRVRLALAYNVPFDKAALLRNLTERKEFGGWTDDERFAAFLIVYQGGVLEDVRDFFATYHDDLFAHNDLNPAALAGIEIEALARTGRIPEARHHIALHTGPHLTVEQATLIERDVSLIEADDEVEGMRRRYEASKSLTDLRFLALALRSRRDWQGLADYAPTLARATRSLDDFDLAIKSLSSAKRDIELLGLTDDLADVFALNDEYLALRGWSLHRVGRVMEARTVSRDLASRRRVASDRELVINTAIESGDWGYLQVILAQEVERLEALDPKDLIRLARLALEAGSPYVDVFCDTALRKAPDDPHVNLSAYLLAVERGGARRGEHAFEWFQKAIDTSGSDGPVRAVSMRELADMAPRWSEHAQFVYDRLCEAEVPLFVAAKGLHRQLIDLIFGQALRNTDAEAGPIKHPIFAVSGSRQPTSLSSLRSAAFDVTGLISLEYLGLLEEALSLFERVVIAPDTLATLFLERQFLKVRQPSEISRAERIQALIAAGRLQVTEALSNESLTDVSTIGHELAQLLASARSTGGILVRPAPVPVVGSFLDQHADMTEHAASLADTLAVLNFLADAGRIDSSVRTAAHAYLSRADTGWSSGPAIDVNSTLFLDDLAVTYLDHVGLLEILTQSVHRVMISKPLDRQTRDVLRQGKHSEALLDAVESIRGKIAKGLEAARIGFSSRQRSEGTAEAEEGSVQEAAPTLDLLSDLTDVDVVVVDDRCLNKLPTWTDKRGKRAIALPVIDVLGALRDAGRVNREEHWMARHRLRTAGYYAMPIDVDELLHHLSGAPLAGGAVRETPELKAVRESIALPLTSGCFRNTEMAWLNRIRLTIFSAIRELWRNASDLSGIVARSDWLLAQAPDPFEWCQSPEDDTVWTAAMDQSAAQWGFMLLFAGVEAERREQYITWLEKRMVSVLPSTRPEVWDAVISFLKMQIPRLLEIDNDNAS